MAPREEDVEMTEVFIQQVHDEDLAANSRRIPVWYFIAALVVAVCIVGFGAKRSHEVRPPLSHVMSAQVLEEMPACSFELLEKEQWCNPAKPIGDAMRKAGQNSPEACAAAAAADAECGVWFNYNPVWQPGAGGCHCVALGGGNEQCSRKGPQQGWAIYSSACNRAAHRKQSPASPAPAAFVTIQRVLARLAGFVAPKVPAALPHSALPHPNSVAPELAQAGRCARPHVETMFEDMACVPMMFIGPAMRTRGNSVESCAETAARDEICGNIINYNPSFQGQGACHCVDSNNSKCTERQSAPGFKVYRLSCATP